MDRKGGQGMAKEREKLLKILQSLESTLLTRATIAFRRSPETFIEEAQTLELVIYLRKKLAD